MSKGSYPGLRLHQSLSFSDFMLRIPAVEAVFWPGCALMNLDPELLEKTLTVLRRAEPEMALATGCCSQITDCLFPQLAEKRRQKLLAVLRKNGVKRIYTACPNCTLQLGLLEEFEIIPIWGVLAEHITPADLSPDSGRYVWHDPCPTRKDENQQRSVRQLLNIRGCDCCEPEHSGCKTRCCGNFRMLHCTDPKKSAALRKKRLAEFPEDRCIASSCEGCLSAFRSEGRDTVHMLELLFGKSKSRGWANRFKTTFRN